MAELRVISERPARKPPWLKVRLPMGATYLALKDLVRRERLHTVCESARCPNLGDCWGRGTATFMLLGEVCTRSCGFCEVTTGRPQGLDLEEPLRVARAVRALGLRHAVLTSVNRDELADGGAGIWAATIRAVRRLSPRCTIEALAPDFQGSRRDLLTLLDAAPDILAHNTETVPRLYRRVRPQAKYGRTLELLRRAGEHGARTKSGLMLGLGEEIDEVRQVLRDLRGVGCGIVNLGQYLQPSPRHLRVERFWHPGEFATLRREALALGFRHVEAGPLVRSSYHAEEQARQAARQEARG
ncbi:MAG: lipoyl synthase [Candidatus Tectomicrobia bacterium]|nr:lipoyl synthase [Candidatus Tectomicrobia bacterium]